MDAVLDQLQSNRHSWNGRVVTLAIALLATGFLTGCGKLSGLGVTKVEARTAEANIGAFLTYQEALMGKDLTAVEGVFGKPKGIFERRSGKVWMYARWCVEFDKQGRVVRMERDVAATGVGAGSNTPSRPLTPKPTAPKPGAPASTPSTTSTPSASIMRVSDSGQTVDLAAHMPLGKITVVDFYADWCGPCRQIAPHLEKLAADNPDVVLVKVDIVKWGTPVTEQYDIKSVPNIRVYDRHRNPVGQPTYKLSEVQTFVETAKR